MMSFRNSFGKSKRNLNEAESTWQIPNKRSCIYRNLMENNTFLFVTTANILERYSCYDKYYKRMIISSSIRLIPEKSFEDFTELDTVIFQSPSSLEYIGTGAFAGCTKLRDIKLPPTLKSIGNGSFSYCTNITDMKLPPQLESIGEMAFYRCHSLSTISIPSSLRTIGSFCFYKCTGITNIYVDIQSRLQSIGDLAFFRCRSLTCMTIPSSLSIIGSFCFYKCAQIKNVILPSTITFMGDYAYQGCTNLQSVIIRSGLRTIKEGTFRRCRQLRSIYIPPSVKTIEDRAFEFCDSLQSITVLPSLRNLGKKVFSHCRKLTVLHIPTTGCSNSIDSFRTHDNETIGDYIAENFDTNLIILSSATNYHEYTNNYEFAEWRPVMMLSDVGNCCYNDLENVQDQSKDIQIATLSHFLECYFPHLAHAAAVHGMNLLHILVHFPCHNSFLYHEKYERKKVFDVIKDVLYKCPLVATSIDKEGRTPIHHLFQLNSRRNEKVVQLLIRYCDHTILHKALKSSCFSFHLIVQILSANPKLLSSIDTSTGFLPFMTAAQLKISLSLVYELLHMKPDVLLTFMEL